MGKTAGVIEINGIRYDTGTGRAISKVKNFAKVKLASSSQVIDGFVKAKKPGPKPRIAVEAKAKPAAKAKPRATHTVRSGAKSIHHKNERSRTLVRSVVVKPSLRLKAATKQFAQPIASEAVSRADALKEFRAKQIKKHALVTRFKTPKSSAASDSPRIGEIVTRQPNQTAATEAVMPSLTLGNTSHQQLERLLDVALHTASSHKQAVGKKRGRFTHLPRWAKIAIIALIALVAALVIIWRNVPAVAVKVAGLQAGTTTSAPAYTPAGFSYSGASLSGDNSFRLSYRSSSSQAQNYTITEAKSSWDSASLAANAIGANVQVQTSEIDGNTIYIYGASDNATWVNNGTWYTIINNAHLSSDQLLHIAGSM